MPADQRADELDRPCTQALFKTGHDLALAGCPWEKHPPGYADQGCVAPAARFRFCVWD
jgi:hypothetical protein